LNQANLDKVVKLGKIASDLDTSLANLAIAWCLKNAHVSTVLTGATKLDQLKQNLNSLDIVPKLTVDVLESIELILDNKPAKPQY